MRALLLAAGFGTRLRPITDTIPKCLVAINGRPLLDFWLELLSNAGVSKILVNLHYLPSAVQTFLASSNYPIAITTVFEDQLLGTAGTVLRNRSFFQNEPVMLIHADNLSLFDGREFIRTFDEREDGIEITMMTFQTDAPETCGIVELDDRGIVHAFHEKVKNPPSNLANAAVYILSPNVIEFIASLNKEVIDFSNEVLPYYLGRINTFHNGTYHRDIGNVESLTAAQVEYPLAVAKKV
ncbi:MAG: nucleotidyltransferase family protein [Burkholderiaceae bacterium]